MDFLPDPLHPAIVHFPVVLILFGTLAAVGAVFWRRHQLPLLAGLLLLLGAAGAWFAVQTGESDGGLTDFSSPQAQQLLDAHENWAKRTLLAAAVAAAAAVISLALVRRPTTARAAAVIAALAAITASYSVYETGHRGGALVFRHGAGVYVVSGASPSGGETAAATGRTARQDRE